MIRTIATIKSGYTEKFGIPRQSGLVPSARAEIIFESEFRSVDAVKGLEEFSYIWLIWGFSEAKTNGFSATVAPPRLGGKEKKGVFATRSPFRPNSLGLSSVKLEQIRYDAENGPVIVVSGADLLDGTPIYDIKPYIPYADSHPDACGSYADIHRSDEIPVVFPEEFRTKLPADTARTVEEILAQDPRAAYNKKEDYVYGLSYGGFDIRFTVKENVIHVCGLVEKNDNWSKVK